MNLPPHFCPLLNPSNEPTAHVEDPVAECRCIMAAGHLNARGNSAFCLGRIPMHRVTTNGILHRNDLALCIYGPIADTGEMLVQVNLVNETDLKWLHVLIHAVLGIDGADVENDSAPGIPTDPPSNSS